MDAAIDAIKRMAAQYEPFVKVAQVLEEVGSLKNAVVELKKATAEAESERAKVNASLKAARAKLKSLDTEAEGILEAANIEAKKRKDTSAKSATERIVAAQQAGQDKFNELVSAAKAEVELMKKGRQKEQNAIESKRKALVKLGTEYNEKAAEFDKLTQALAELKKKVSDIG